MAIILVPAAEAAAELEKLLTEAAHGRTVVIIGDDGSAYQLVALPGAPKPKPRFGGARGLIEIRPNFDEPVPGFDFWARRGRGGKERSHEP